MAQERRRGPTVADRLTPPTLTGTPESGPSADTEPREPYAAFAESPTLEAIEAIEAEAQPAEVLDPRRGDLSVVPSAEVGPAEQGPAEASFAAHPVMPRSDPGSASDHGATAPQLRRFIKSRAYVPMHELRRRFAINGGDDDVTAVEVERQRVYVGLPEREGRLLNELLRGGDIGVELSLDPIAPIVVGVYPIRPIPRT